MVVSPALYSFVERISAIECAKRRVSSSYGILLRRRSLHSVWPDLSKALRTFRERRLDQFAMALLWASVDGSPRSNWPLVFRREKVRLPSNATTQ